MNNSIRLAGLGSLLVVSLACSSGGTDTAQSATPQSGSPAAAEQPVASPAAAPAAGQTAATPSSPAAAQPGTKSAAAQPPAETKQVMMEMTVPAGTALNLALETPVSSDGSKVEDAVRAKVTKPIVISGMTVIPEGAEVVGSVISANQSGRVKGLASVTLRFNRVTVAGQTINIRTAQVVREAEPTKKEDAKKVGIGAGAGALIGALAGGKKGAAVWTAVGAGAGTGAVLATRGDEVRLEAGAPVRTTIEEAVKIMAPM